LVTTNHFNALERALETAGQLGYDDVFAAEALISAMAGWDEAELAEYRQAVLSELAARGNRPLEGFLAVEVVALCVVTPTA
jgi:hypothetical protein